MHIGFEADIRKFKSVLCNETALITEALKREFSNFVLSPLLDVGAGFQAISLDAFPEIDVTLLDVIDYGSHAPGENRVTADFFEYQPPSTGKPRTLLFCHVLQYIDEDKGLLYEKVRSLAPDRIITVVNDNDLEFGEMIQWAKQHMPESNPEENVPMWPLGYGHPKRVQFTATLSCPDFGTLAYQFGRLILDLSKSQSRSPALLEKLRSILPKPEIRINQSIYGYERQN